jgi:hypothetical protein
VLKTETSVQTSVWRHIAVVKNGTTYSIHVDGVCENTHTGGLNAIGLTNFKIGARSGPLGYFSGTIDEVGVWNRAMELGDIKNPESNTINYIRINGISELPSGIARNPSVLNGQTDVAINEVLSWSPGEVVADVNGHRVYFGTDFNDVNQDLISYITLSSPNFNPGVMDFNTIYYWRVDEVNDSNMWEGNVWRFTTHSGSARNPTPADNTKNVPLNVELSWHPGDRAADVNGHDVYVGADSDAVRYGTRLLTGDVDGNGWVNFGDMLVVSNEWLDTSAVSSLAADLDYNDKIDLADFSIVAGQWGGTTTSYKGRQDANSYTSSGHQSGTTYYWRVDEVNDSNVWAGDIWSFTTKNEGALPALANAPTPLVIPTFDGFGQAMHPDIAYFPDKWNGYNYWMAMTPFTYSNNQSEDPSIVVSDNGLTWEVPPGLTNPLIVAPPAGHNADPAIVYNDDANELWVYFMRYWKTPNQVKLALMKSGDGVNWTEPEYLLTWNLSSSDNERSYSIIKQGSDWHYWGQSNDAPHKIYYRYSTDGENWSETTSVTFSLPPSLAPWHLSVIYVPTKSEYWMLFTAPGGAIGSALFFAKSTDMLHWTLYTNEVLVPSGAGWDNGQIYKSTMLYDSDRQTFRIWYSASDTFLKWGTGYIETNY